MRRIFKRARNRFLSFSCFLFSSVALGQPIPATLLQDDFPILRNALEEAHGGIYRYTSKRDMDRTFDRAFRQINRPMTDLEFWRLIAPVVAHIKCGHTFLWFPRTIQTRFETDIRVFPLEVRILAGRAYIYQDCSNAGSPLEGSELLAINDVPIATLLRQLRAVITGDGHTAVKDWRVSHLGGCTVYLHALGIEGPFRVKYRTNDGKRRTTELAGLTIPDRQKAWGTRNPPTPETNADLKFLDDGNIAVLTIRHWYKYADPKHKVTFLDFLVRSFAQIQEHGSSSLIIDVRDNDGGLDEPGKQLFAFLWDRPFRYDDKLVINAREFDFFKYDPDAKPIREDILERQPDGRFHLVKHPNLGVQTSLQPHFGGRVSC